MEWPDLSTTNALYAVLATGAAVSALAFGIGRSILLARITSTEARRVQIEESATTWRRKVSDLEHQFEESRSESQKQLRERTDAVARLEDQLERAKRDTEFNDATLKKRIAELETLVKDKDQALAQQERDFRERVSRMTTEMKSVVAKLTNNAA